MMMALWACRKALPNALKPGRSSLGLSVLRQRLLHYRCPCPHLVAPMGFKQLQRDVAALQQRGQGVVRLELEDSIVACRFAACRAPIGIVFCQPR